MSGRLQRGSPPQVVSITFTTGASRSPAGCTALISASYTAGSNQPRTTQLEVLLPMALFCQVTGAGSSTSVITW